MLDIFVVVFVVVVVFVFALALEFVVEVDCCCRRGGGGTFCTTFDHTNTDLLTSPLLLLTVFDLFVDAVRASGGAIMCCRRRRKLHRFVESAWQ